MIYRTPQLVDMWNEVFGDGPTVLSDSLLERIEPHLDPKNKEILKSFVRSWKEELRWIEEQRRDFLSELGRVKHLGITIQAAGLRSYTDKEGRIYVAAGSRGEE